jgi:acyl-CoA dehydrogenase
LTLDFALSEEQQLLVDAATDFVRRECPPELIREHARAGTFDPQVWKKFAATGWLGLGVSPEHGGSGGTVLDAALVLEATAPAIEAIGPTFATMCFGGQMLDTMGTPEQKAKLLPRLVDGDARFALSITEPGGGTDVLGAMKTTAARVEGGWVINGAKVFTSASTDAHFLVVVARTSPPEASARGGGTRRRSQPGPSGPSGRGGAKQAYGVSVFLVDRDAPGVTLTPLPAMNDEDTNAAYYDDVFVADDRLLGELDRGFYGLLAMLNNERIGIGALCVGWGQAALDQARAYALERQAFGGVIGRFQAVQHHIARMHLLVQQARLMVYRAAWLQSEGRPCGLEATAAKSVAAENVFEACDRGMQVMGGIGYTTECDINRYWRRVRLFRLAPISNEMALNSIAEWLGMPRSF